MVADKPTLWHQRRNPTRWFSFPLSLGENKPDSEAGQQSEL